MDYGYITIPFKITMSSDIIVPRKGYRIKVVIKNNEEGFQKEIKTSELLTI